MKVREFFWGRMKLSWQGLSYVTNLNSNDLSGGENYFKNNIK
jgi:hypothetical protein